MKSSKIIFNYLDHIDALRAISVILVILFHINPDIFFYGYLGVDIFFVISGYVISNSIYEQQILGKKCIADFYIKRFKRIFPILFLVVSTFFIFYILISPLSGNTDFFFLSGIFSLLGASNLYFLNNETNYFLSESINPLLHTWSLGIEEQFYVLYPIFIINIFSLFKNNFTKIFFTIFIFILISLLLYFFTKGISSNFYFPFSRFWQIGFGCLAFFYFNIKSKYKIYFNFFLIIGSIIFYVYFFENSVKISNLITTIITFFLILSLRGIENGSINNYIKKSQLPYIGKLSYSLYLWHLPILYFCEIYFSGIILIFIFSIITISFSIISYHKFESPLRKSTKLEKFIKSIPKFIPVISICSVSIFFIFSSYNIKNSYEFLKKLNYPEIKLGNYLNRIDFKYNNYLQSECSKEKFYLNCKISDGKEASVYLTGDSHADHFLPAIDNLKNINSYYFNNFALCKIILSTLSISNDTNFDNCLKTNNSNLNYLKQDFSQFKDKTIFISLRISEYLKPEWKIKESNEDGYNKIDLIKKNYLKFFENFEGSKFILMNTIPESSIHTEKCLFNEFLFNKLNEKIYKKCHFKKKEDIDRYLRVTEILNSISAKKENVSIFDPYNILCPNKICHNFDVDNDKIILIDKDHLSVEASKSLTKYIEIFLKDL